MSHFSSKSLTLYGVAITTVVVVFNIVSAYGESNLKAPPAIKGLYRLETGNLPACLQADGLVLMLEQSGIYLRGQILPQSAVNSPESLGEETPSLNGQWNNQQINLSGSLSQFKDCQKEQVSLKASWQNKTLTGQLNFKILNEVVKFTGQQEQVKKTSTQTH